MQTLSRQVRWGVPAAAVAAVAAVTAGSLIAVAQAAPRLAPRTPAQLLAAVAGTDSAPPPLTGTVVETASLGIPQLPGAAAPSSMTSLLTGSHTIRVWYADPDHVRLALPVQMGETDLVRNGSTAWLWQSSANTATRYSIPAGHEGKQAQLPAKAPMTPQQAAQQALKAAGPSTAVSTESNVDVAGQAAYQLVLTPKDSRSLIGRVTIALDGQHSQVPLRVQVFARGATSPAFQVGYTAISFVRPAASNFAFSPPPGAKVRKGTMPDMGQRMPAAGKHALSGARIIGKDWLSVAVLPSGGLAGMGNGGSAAAAAGQAAQSASGSGSGSGPGSAEVLGALLGSAKPVHGAWGSGRLLRTGLVSVLIMNNGHMLVGAVTPAVLYADAAQVK